MDLRVARADDYDRIVGVIDEWWGRPIGLLLPRLFLDHFHSTSRVAEDERGLAGFLVAFISPSQPTHAYIHFVGVRPDLRRAGLARQFYEELATYARARGCRELHAVTAAVNDSSIRFHVRAGFTASDPVTDYDGPGQTMVTFRRELAASLAAS